MQGTAAGNHRRFAGQLIWHQGSIVLYESLWSVLHRLSCLNILYVDDMGFLRSRVDGYRGMNSLIVNYRLVDLASLAKCLEEPLYVFRLATLEKLSPWTHALFHKFTLRFCPQCLACGYHSALHGLKALGRCPIHDADLEHHCRCGKAISACLNRGLFSAPKQCDCGRMQFYAQERARRPTVSSESAEAFDEVARWVESSSRRVYMMCDHSDQRVAAYDAGIHQLMPVWSKLICSRVPTAIDVNQIPDLTMQADITVGGPFLHLAVSSNEDRSGNSDLRILVFRAIDRHIRRHVLRGQHWISRLCMSCDADFIRTAINASSEARLAWTYLLWLMTVFGGTQLQALRSNVGKQAYRRGMRLPHVSAFKPFAPCSMPMHRWMEMHATAVYLGALWADAVQLGLGMVATQNVAWGDSLVNCDGAYRWVAALSSGNRIVIGAAIVDGASIRSCERGIRRASACGATPVGAPRGLPDVGLVKWAKRV